MYAHRQIYNHVQDSVPVPEPMRNQRVEVIFMVLDDEPAVCRQEGLGTLALQMFSAIEYTDDAEFQLPEREHGQAVTFE